MLFEEKNIFLQQDFKTREEVLQFIATQAEELNLTEDRGQVYDALMARENEYSTAMQENIAIPHAKTDAIKEASLMFVQLAEPIKWSDENDTNVKIAFSILVPESEKNTGHLQILSTVAVSLMDEDFQEFVLNVDNKAEMLEKFNEIIGG